LDGILSTKMGSFNDLPKDVIWLIFKEVIIDFLAQHYRATIELDDTFLIPHSKLCTSKKKRTRTLKRG